MCEYQFVFGHYGSFQSNSATHNPTISFKVCKFVAFIYIFLTLYPNRLVNKNGPLKKYTSVLEVLEGDPGPGWIQKCFGVFQKYQSC